MIDGCPPAAEAAVSARPESALRRLLRSIPWQVIGLTAVMAVALAIRIAHLDTIPANVTADENDFAKNVYHILAGTGPGLFGFDWTPSPILPIYLMAGTMKVFGVGILGMRMYPVLLSMGALVAFFFLARERLSYLASLLATLLLASNLWFLHFSRTAWTNMNADLFAISGALMLALAIRKGKWYFYVGAGVFAALGLYGYFSGRLIVIFFLVFLPFALFLNRNRLKQIIVGYVILLLTCFLVFLPQIKPIINNWDSFNRRVETTSILNVEPPYFGESNMTRIYLRQVVWAGRAFILIDDGSVMQHGLWTRYTPADRGLLSEIVIPLYYLGLVVAVWRWRQTALWWLMFLGPMFTTQVLSGGTPDAARGLIAAPFMFLFVGEGIDVLISAGRRVGGRIKGAELAVSATLVAVASFAAFADVRGYFDWIGTPGALAARNPSNSLEIFPKWAELERQAAEEGPGAFDFRKWCTEQDLAADELATKLCQNTAPDLYQPQEIPPIAVDDELRRSDLGILFDALGKYEDKYAAFPSTGGQVQSLCVYPQQDAGCKLEEFLSKLPEGEAILNRAKAYWYVSDEKTFALYAAMEKEPLGGPCPSVPAHLIKVEHLYCVSGP